jgi:uncharacterized protein (DUF433 family)
MDVGRICAGHQVIGGVLRVAGPRILVATVAGMVANGLSAEEITAEYP